MKQPAGIRSFAPVSSPAARFLILGSMPGEASLRAGQYYAHPRNAFWPIMGKIFGAAPEKPYEERLRILTAHGIALWDVLEHCVRPGSLDASISEEVPNDFETFLAERPHIDRIGLNGGTAAALFKKYAARHAPEGAILTRLPSTSPAHAAMGFKAKFAAWQGFFDGGLGSAASGPRK